MSLADCKVAWSADATLMEIPPPSTKKFEWVGDPLYAGPVAGALRFFRTLPPKRQQLVEMFVDPHVVEGTTKSILGFDELNVLAHRADLPAGRSLSSVAVDLADCFQWELGGGGYGTVTSGLQ